MMTPFLGEFLGTTLLVLLGNGVVANVVLQQTKGNNSGWIVITMGWAMAVFVGVFVSGTYSGAHLNPAVSIALAAAGKFGWSSVPTYILAQMLGAALGTTLVWLQYRQHYNISDDSEAKLATFATIPAIYSPLDNLISEIIGAFVLLIGVLYMISSDTGLGAISALPVAFLVLGIGLSLGGTTGYAINPARDLAPRIMHAILPIPNKGSSNWYYAWIPVVGPIIGGILAVQVWRLLGH